MAAEELKAPTKTGSLDDSVMLDDPKMFWAEPYWEALKMGDPNAKLWDFDYNFMRRELLLVAQ